MAKLMINDLPASRKLDRKGMSSIRGGYSRTSYSTLAGSTSNGSNSGPGGPRPPEDQIIWPDNPFDIWDLIK